MVKAALFDMDGVIFDTESQYTEFWRNIRKIYHLDIDDFEARIKGQTLSQIFSNISRIFIQNNDKLYNF